MKKQNTWIAPLSINRNGQRFFKAVITPEYVYYVDYRESDEYSAVLIYNKRGELLSDNCHAANSLLMDIEEKRYIHLSRTMQYNVRRMQETA
jgi:hypothetical protein